MGTGYSESDKSIAFGISGQTKTGNVIYKLAGAVNTSNIISLSAGINYSVGELEKSRTNNIKFIIKGFDDDKFDIKDSMTKDLVNLIEFLKQNNIKNIEIISYFLDENTQNIAIMRANSIKQYILSKVKVNVKLFNKLDHKLAGKSEIIIL